MNSSHLSLQVTQKPNGRPGEYLVSSVHTYVNVIRCPLVAGILDGNPSMVNFGHNKNVTLELGKYSYDPDIGDPLARSLVRIPALCRHNSPHRYQNKEYSY